MDLFDTEPPEELQKLPFKFSYDFACADSYCTGHQMICTDWEMSELYRKSQAEPWRWLGSAFQARYEREMIDKNDTHLYVGTLHQYPATWIIVGVFYPQPVKQTDLFRQH